MRVSTVQLDILRATFRYNGKLGRLYKGTQLVRGTPKHEGGPLVVWHQGRQVKYARLCFALAHGYQPAQVRHRDGNDRNNRQDNLYDPAVSTSKGARFPGVYIVKCQKTGRFRGYRGIFTHQGKRFYTPVVEKIETARDLRVMLVVQVEYEASQEKTHHDTRTSGAV